MSVIISMYVSVWLASFFIAILEAIVSRDIREGFEVWKYTMVYFTVGITALVAVVSVGILIMEGM